MKGKNKCSILFRCILLSSVALIAIILTLILNSDQAKAISGQSQVKEIDLFWATGSDTIKARVHLDTGIALTYEAQNEKENDMLIEFAQIFSTGKSKLFVEMEKDRIKTFQVSAFR